MLSFSSYILFLPFYIFLSLLILLVIFSYGDFEPVILFWLLLSYMFKDLFFIFLYLSYLRKFS